MRRAIIVGIIATLTIAGFVSCNWFRNSPKTTTNKPIQVSLRQEWFPFSGYAGELVAVNETASKYNLSIRLDAGSDQIDPIKLVLSGENDFGVVSSDRILQANEKGADLVVLGVVNYISPTCFIAKQSSGIKTPSDFAGRKVGILTGTNTELVYKILKAKTGVDNQKVTEVEIPFDLATFISGAYDVRPAFIYDEPVSLDQQQVTYNIIKPSDYGIKFIGTVYFTRRAYLESHPEVVKSFVFAIADGWREAIQHPDKAIRYLKQYDSNIDSARESLSLAKGIEYFRGEDGKVLFASENTWTEMARQLIQIKAINSIDYSRTVKNEFVKEFHSK
jgi:NitT/TauT family transport system substrate-binding protein